MGNAGIAGDNGFPANSDGSRHIKVFGGSCAAYDNVLVKLGVALDLGITVHRSLAADSSTVLDIETTCYGLVALNNYALIKGGIFLEFSSAIDRNFIRSSITESSVSLGVQVSVYSFSTANRGVTSYC